jgi:bacteriocin-like protein
MYEKMEIQVKELSQEEMEKIEGGMIGAGVYGDGAPFKSADSDLLDVRCVGRLRA